MPKHQPTKHITYYELLDAVRDTKGCPLCRLEACSMRRYFESLLHESVNDPGVRADLARSGGYCHRHAHQLRGHGNGLGIAILYQDQIQFFLEWLAGLETSPSAILRRGVRIRMRQVEGCPACRIQKECRRRYGSVLIEWLCDPEMLSALQAGDGLCVPHFLGLLEMPMDQKAKAILVNMQKEKMMSLCHELMEFQRKHDYRYQHEGSGREFDSWLRAIRTMVGEDGVF